MEFEIALELVEQLVQEKTGKPLLDAEKAVFQGAWSGLTYDQIAEKSSNYEANYLKGDVGPNFWKLLSEVFGEQVSKRNVRTVLEKWEKQPQPTSPVGKTPATQIPEAKNQPRDDWGYAPDVSNFCGRTEEINTLKRWIVEDKCRMVGILGLGGMGKTTLAVRMGQQVKGEFDRCIYRVLRETYTFDKFLGDLPTFLTGSSPQNTEEDVYDKISRVIDGLRDDRCLLILDNVEAILQPGDRFGRYRTGFEAYGQLFRKVGEVAHQSCLVVVSRETFPECDRLSKFNQSVKSLELKGLKVEEVQELLQNTNLTGKPQHWQGLIEMYGGTPLALRLVAPTIQEFVGGDLAKYLKDPTLYLDKEYKSVLAWHWERLSDLEQKVLRILAEADKTISFDNLRQQMPDYSMSDLIETLNSLRGRSLLEKTASPDNEPSGFCLQPVIQKYIIKHQFKS
jgi:NB-ARC domain